jgi:hypothetical protein
MRSSVAIAELEKLAAEAADPLTIRPTQRFASWKSRVESVLSRSLGSGHHITAFKKVRYSLLVASANTPDSTWERAFVGGVKDALGHIEAAVFELGLLQAGDEPVDEHVYDPDLWKHVKVHVEDEDWGKVASQAAIFVEDRVRAWAGSPKDKGGNELVGKALYLAVFDDSSDYRLGRQAGEREGWRFLGMGFAQALSNVDRHRIQDRDDARRYAIGVLGLGSLLLTQIRYEHGDILQGS